MQQHTGAGCRYLRGERHDTAQIAATARGKRHPGAVRAKDLVIDVHAAYVGYGHRSSSRLQGDIVDLLSDMAIMHLSWAPVNF